MLHQEKNSYKIEKRFYQRWRISALRVDLKEIYLSIIFTQNHWWHAGSYLAFRLYASPVTQEEKVL